MVKVMDAGGSAKPLSADGGRKGNDAAPIQEPVIQLHKPCLNCAQPTSMILDLYKLACLAYAPSPVMINGQENTRRFYLD